MSEPELLVEKNGGYAIVTLNRPQAMNALSAPLRTGLVDTMNRLADEQVRVVIVTGAGRAFCAGRDLKELGTGTGVPLGSEESWRIVDAFAQFPGPVIGAINGAAVTGGFELALACDILIASTNARFADTHVRVGLLPGWGLSQKLSRLIGIYRAKELSLSGNFISAEQAASWGLVNRVVAPDELLPQARKLAEDMLANQPDVLVQYKRLIDEGFAQAFGDAIQFERQASREFNTTVKPEALAERREGVQARGRQGMG